MNKEWQALNINTLVRITRTPEVDKLVQLEYDTFWNKSNPCYLKNNPVPFSLQQDTPFLEMPLWSFAATFGGFLFNGNVLPKELITIEIYK